MNRDPILRGRVIGGRMEWASASRRDWKRVMESLEGCEVEVVIRKRSSRVTIDQHAYYRAVIVPAVAEKSGYESEAEAHNALKAGFFGLTPGDPNIRSMATFSQDEATRFIEYAIRTAAEIGAVIQEPWEAMVTC